MKIKIFRDSNHVAFTKNVNTFCELHDVIDIKYSTVWVPIAYENGVPINSTMYDSAMILYKED